MSGGLTGALALIVPAAEAALVELTGLASGFAAAGAGPGAFALLALPAFHKVQQGYAAVNAAHMAYMKAVATYNVDPTAAHAAAVTRALDAQKLALTGLDPAQRAAVHQHAGVHAPPSRGCRRRSSRWPSRSSTRGCSWRTSCCQR